jgi:hypothetical protein
MKATIYLGESYFELYGVMKRKMRIILVAHVFVFYNDEEYFSEEENFNLRGKISSIYI